MKQLISGLCVSSSLLILLATAPSFAGEISAATDNKSVSAGQALYESYCLACHLPKKAGRGHSGGHGAGAEAGHQKRLAPPMAMVKKHYLQAYPEQSVFVQKLSTWISGPNNNSALLSHAVERFGLMPALAIDEDLRRQIAQYIFDTIMVGHCKEGGGGKHGEGGKGGGKGQGKASHNCQKP